MRYSFIKWPTYISCLAFIFSIASFSQSVESLEGIWKGTCAVQGTTLYTSLTFFIFNDGFTSVEQEFCSDPSCMDPAFISTFKGDELRASGESASNVALSILSAKYLVIIPYTASAIELLENDFANTYNVAAHFEVGESTAFDASKDLKIVSKTIAVAIMSEGAIRLGDITVVLENGATQVFTQLNGCQLSI